MKKKSILKLPDVKKFEAVKAPYTKWVNGAKIVVYASSIEEASQKFYILINKK